MCEQAGQAVVQAAQLGGEGVQDVGQQLPVPLGHTLVRAARKDDLDQVQQQAHARALHAHGQAAVVDVPARRHGRDFTRMLCLQGSASKW